MVAQSCYRISLHTLLKAPVTTLETENWVAVKEVHLRDSIKETILIMYSNSDSLRVQVPNNHILTQNLYYNYYYPKPKCLFIGYLDLPV